MDAGIYAFIHVHPLGDAATNPLSGLWKRLAVLRSKAGHDPAAVLHQPDTLAATPAGAFN